jgi:hypothetical protein
MFDGHCRMPPSTTAKMAGIGDFLKQIAGSLAPRRGEEG